MKIHADAENEDAVLAGRRRQVWEEQRNEAARNRRQAEEQAGHGGLAAFLGGEARQRTPQRTPDRTPERGRPEAQQRTPEKSRNPPSSGQATHSFIWFFLRDLRHV